ncbi:uncharacterized protein CXorf65 homolog [Babylonia areolata]|uniref:uncharacterized protein CXorf65 homolog n=1 Tax=Babylonia areolata TaxID=304850 RepID=UPI003FD142FD
MDAFSQSFIIVKYGDNQEAIFNPWCSSHTLLEWIRRKCQCDEDIILDLVDLEGQVRNLPSSTEEYASDYVTGRETYILIRVDKQDDSGRNRYVSLLNNLDEINPDLMVKLNNLSRPSTRNKMNKSRKNLRPNRNSAKPESAGKRPVSGERRSKQGK